jgi:tetratricopeptide (TPR) repeat protein
LLPKALEAQTSAAQPGFGPSEADRAMQALAKLADGQPAEAAALLEPVSFRSSLTDIVNIWALAKMQAGDYAAAEKGLAYINSSDARTGLSATTAFGYASLARVQAQLGNKAEARKNYQRFFDLFKDADPDLPLLLQAKEEFGKLGS